MKYRITWRDGKQEERQSDDGYAAVCALLGPSVDVQLIQEEEQDAGQVEGATAADAGGETQSEIRSEGGDSAEGGAGGGGGDPTPDPAPQAEG